MNSVLLRVIEIYLRELTMLNLICTDTERFLNPVVNVRLMLDTLRKDCVPPQSNMAALLVRPAPRQFANALAISLLCERRKRVVENYRPLRNFPNEHLGILTFSNLAKTLWPFSKMDSPYTASASRRLDTTPDSFPGNVARWSDYCRALCESSVHLLRMKMRACILNFCFVAVSHCAPTLTPIWV